MRLQEKYEKEVVPAMIKRFGYKTRLAVPKIKKVVINTGIGRLIVQSQAGGAESFKKTIEEIRNSLALICGQRPQETKAKKSIAAFKIRQGMILGFKVTLRGKKMNDFLERLINAALPRSRDFRGLDHKAVGEDGNLTIGIKEHIIFPEVSQENIRHILGLEITMVTDAKTHEKGLELFKLMGLPIKKN